MKKKVSQWIWDLIYCFYPKICPVCYHPIRQPSHFVCHQCFSKIPWTQFWKFSENPLRSIFWGKLPVQNIDSMMHFRKDGIVRMLLHRIKYHRQPELAEELGMYWGNFLLQKQGYQKIDLIIPIPMHPHKLKKRGYNQAELIAKGLSQVFQKKLRNNILLKKDFTNTQTKMNRSERWQNLQAGFSVHHSSQIQGKHILLVDDVLTTGATLHAAGQILLEQGAKSISMATLACVV